MIKSIIGRIIGQNEKKLGVELDYSRKILETDLPLLMRYNKIFGFLDGNKNCPKEAYHIARVRGALAADCGTCVEAELNLAQHEGVAPALLVATVQQKYDDLDPNLAAVAKLADAVVGQRIDDGDARDAVRAAYGEKGLIELCFAMNGAALLPGIKRGMGYAVACNLDTMRKVATGNV